MKRFALLLIATVLLAPLSLATAGPVYFLVSERAGEAVHNDSFVVPISDPAHIAHARDLISRGPDAAGEPIVVAKIAAGADGINLDYLDAHHRPWDWHVSEFANFAGSTVEVLDGWPTFVQQDVPGWIRNTNGYVGFWSYTITQELADVTPPPAAIPLPASAVAGLPVLLGTLLFCRRGMTCLALPGRLYLLPRRITATPASAHIAVTVAGSGTTAAI